MVFFFRLQVVFSWLQVGFHGFSRFHLGFSWFHDGFLNFFKVLGWLYRSRWVLRVIDGSRLVFVVPGRFFGSRCFSFFLMVSGLDLMIH